MSFLTFFKKYIKLEKSILKIYFANNLSILKNLFKKIKNL